MKTHKLLIPILLFALGSQVEAQTHQKIDGGAQIRLDAMDLEIRYYSPTIVRVVKTPTGKPLNKTSLSVIKSPEQLSVSISRKADELSIKSKELTTVVQLQTGAIRFEDPKAAVLLREKAHGAQFTDFNDAGSKTLTVAQAFVLDADEPIYGLGILQNGKMSQRNQTVRMVQNNTWDFVPFFQSIKGYGLFWDNYSPTTFKDASEGTSFTSEVGEGIDYYFMNGGNADGVVACMRDLTGDAPMFPLWSYGYWQSKERYKTQQEIVGVVEKHRQLNVPLDGIIQDWQYWGNNYLWNAMAFLNEDFPNAPKMMEDIHGMNAHVAISIWSSFGPATRQYRELEKINALFSFNTWPESGLTSWPPNMDYPSGVRVYDPYNPQARDIYWKYLKEGLFSLGIDAWWMDSTEPDHLSFKPEDMDTKTHMGSFRKVRNAYPLMTVGGVFDNQRATTSDKRVYILTRSAFAGQQRYGSNTWSGDVNSSWESLRNQVPAGLNFSLCGIPYWNSDIGGFFASSYKRQWNDGAGAKNPAFQELYVRWLQFGAFTTMMRSHGTDIPREIYQFGKKGEPIYDAIESSIRLRYALLPYIYSTAWDVTHAQSSMMRALFMDFSNDKKVWDCNDAFMFGPSFLVAPILHAQYTPEKIVRSNEDTGWNRDTTDPDSPLKAIDFRAKKQADVYLPAGTDWYDFWTNELLAGGQKRDIPTRIDQIPLYIKAGSILPMGPDVQYATEKDWSQLEIRVYRGSDGKFVLYEDENDNYNYEKGFFTTIEFQWNEAKKRLTISNRNGSFNGMLNQRRFDVLCISSQGIERKSVDYTGKRLHVDF
ncbi:MAG: glycoside hydrolase family 31 protein [Bacteroidales bacterium]|nr:glycoside hydrolase family 31 protein [Bacteroidales bacterium]